MRDFLTVFSYTFYQNAKKKAFIITTVILLLLAVILLSIPGIIDHFDKNKKNTSVKPPVTSTTVEKKGTVYFEDDQGVFANEMDQFSKAFAGYEFKAVSKDQTGGIKEEIKSDTVLSQEISQLRSML